MSFLPPSPTWLLWTSLVSSWVCRATSGRHCKVLRAWRCKVQNASFSTPSTSTTTSQLQQLHGSFLGGKHLMLTSLLAHTTALHCVWFLPFHTRGGSDRSPGAGHRSGRLSQGALPVSGMPWGPVWGLLCQPSIYSLRAIYSCTARHAQLRDLGLRLEIKSRSGQSSECATARDLKKRHLKKRMFGVGA